MTTCYSCGIRLSSKHFGDACFECLGKYRQELSQMIYERYKMENEVGNYEKGKVILVD